MRARLPAPDLDATDLRILDLLQESCKRPLASIGEKVGLSAPAVMERVHKMEEAGVIHGYVALVDARLLGLDVTAFIGVSVAHPRMIGAFEREVVNMDAVLECHHVTGAHTLLLKVRTVNTEGLEELIDRIRSVEGVTRTETNVVLSTQTERTRIALDLEEADAQPRQRRIVRERTPRAGRPAQ
ncbi:MAG: Lrp/AsnC family transcriptional regulator [Deltaproteobacteria bacterium]|nr:Lrp/AsnC family transcriptional regulator [Deltaproteobacteria bacterium]